MKNNEENDMLISPKGRLLTLFLSIFFGIIFFGIPFHNLYLGHKKKSKYQVILFSGIFFFIVCFSAPLMIGSFSFGGFLGNIGSFLFFIRILWWLIEIFLIAFGLAKDGDGLPVKRWFEKRD